MGLCYLTNDLNTVSTNERNQTTLGAELITSGPNCSAQSTSD